MTINQGLFSYPGIVQWEDAQITDVSGISPSVCIVTMYPQDGLPDAEGDIVFTYNDQRFGLQMITFAGCKIDAASYQRNSGGQVISVRILDERWAWQYGSITGRYNYKLPNNWVDPEHEQTPQELATMCFDAMGVEDFDVSALPNDARPDIDWDASNPAQELAKLCDDLGCRIVCQRSTGQWVIVVTGEGQDLPEWGGQYNDAGYGFDPKELPDFIKIVTAPKKFQVALKLDPIGKETDLSWKYIGDLSYAQEPGVPESAFGFGREPSTMGNMAKAPWSIRAIQPDGSKVSPWELALQSVFRSWRIYDSGDGIDIPGYDGEEEVTRKQLVLTDQLVDIWTDAQGGEHTRAAFIFGEFRAEIGEMNNFPPGTRIDKQGNEYKVDEEQRASFSLTINPIDTDLSIVVTSKPMTKYGYDSLNRQVYGVATLFLTCAVQVRDPDTWQPVRYEYLQQIGDGADEDFCLVFIKEDIQPWYKTSYDENGNPLDTTNNEDEVQQQCQYYADAYAKTLETILTATRTYFGFFPIDLDGAIQQVTYRVGKQGADTIASYGSEHDFDIPDYWARRRRDATHSNQDRLDVLKQIMNRKLAMQGTSHT